MIPAWPTHWPLRRLVLLEFLAVAVILSGLLYASVQLVAGRATDDTQDRLLAASAFAIAERVYLVEGTQPRVDIPFAELAVLGMSEQERVFFRVSYADGRLLTGYGDLPLIDADPPGRVPVYASLDYKGLPVRAALVISELYAQGQRLRLRIEVAQTLEARREISSSIALSAAVVSIGFLVIAGLLGMIAVSRALAPLHRIETLLLQRDPGDLSPFHEPAPREVQPLLEAFNQFMEKMRVSLDSTQQFIADAAHRIRTPMATLRAQAELALRDSGQQSSHGALKQMLHAVDETSQLTQQLLSQAMVSYRRDRGVREPVLLPSLLSMAVRDLEVTAELRGSVLRLLADGEDELRILGDEIALLEALRNLIDNAIKYTPAGGEITVQLVRISASTTCVVIADNGPGISAQEREHIFQRFYRGDSSSGTIGSGLGLYIAQQVLVAHGGSIELGDNQPRGLEVRLTIPVQ